MIKNLTMEDLSITTSSIETEMPRYFKIFSHIYFTKNK